MSVGICRRRCLHYTSLSEPRGLLSGRRRFPIVPNCPRLKTRVLCNGPRSAICVCTSGEGGNHGKWGQLGTIEAKKRIKSFIYIDRKEQTHAVDNAPS
jgi:hypothetical protein